MKRKESNFLFPLWTVAVLQFIENHEQRSEYANLKVSGPELKWDAEVDCPFG